MGSHAVPCWCLARHKCWIETPVKFQWHTHASQQASTEVCEYMATPLPKVQTLFKYVTQQSRISTNLRPL